MRLIDADELKNRIQNGYVCLIPDPETDKIIQMIENSIIEVINEAPTVTSDKYINKQQAKDKLLEEELGVLKDTPDGEAYYRNGYCTKCKAQMPTEVLHGKISQRSIKFCFNCGAKINGSLWTLIEEGIIKEK